MGKKYTLNEIVLNPDYDIIVEGFFKDKLSKLFGLGKNKLERKAAKHESSILKMQNKYVKKIVNSGIVDKDQYGILQKNIDNLLNAKLSTIRQPIINRNFDQVVHVTRTLASDIGTIIKNDRKKLFTFTKKSNAELVGDITSTIILVAIIEANIRIISYVVGILFTPMLGANAATILRYITWFVIRPVMSEIGRFFAIKSGKGGEYFIIYNAVETFDVVSNALKAGMKPLVVIAYRIMSLAAQYSSSQIQLSAQDKNKGGLGYVLAVFINIAYNIMFSVINRVSSFALK